MESGGTEAVRHEEGDVEVGWCGGVARRGTSATQGRARLAAMADTALLPAAASEGGETGSERGQRQRSAPHSGKRRGEARVT